MPAITRNTLEKSSLQEVLETNVNGWNVFFENRKIKNVLDELIDKIQSENFFTTKNYSIEKCLDFLKSYVKAQLTDPATYDHDVLKKLTTFLDYFRDSIFHQTGFDEEQIGIATYFLGFLKLLFESRHRAVFKENKRGNIKFKAEDLKQIAVTVVKHKNATIDDFVRTYISTLKLSFDMTSFLQDYKQANEGITTVAKIIFLDEKTNVNLLIPDIFSGLAYEFKLIDFYRNDLSAIDSRAAHENILKAIFDLQKYFFDHSQQRGDVSIGVLKNSFFKYFMTEANIPNSLKDSYKNHLSYYADENFDPLPNTYRCSSVPNDHFIIKHDGLDKPVLEVVCQAKVCTDRNHAEWLNNISYNQSLLINHYTYHIFNNKSSYERDIYRYVKFGPMSTGFFTGISRNKTHAIGHAYVKYRSDRSSWWQVSAHEYAHDLNFKTFGYIPRSFDEGLAYRVILDSCFDSSFQHWFNQNRNNYTSLALLSNRDFIGYNPSSLFMAYFVETNHPGFTKILSLYQNNHPKISSAMTQLIQEDKGFLPWLASYQTYCSQHSFSALGNGDNYCPELLKRSIENSYPKNVSTGKISVPPVVKNSTSIADSLTKPTADEMGRALIFAIYNNKFAQFQQLLQQGANPNYRDPYTGDTLLHYLYHYGNCKLNYLQLLLTYNATSLPNNQNDLPLDIAKQRCNDTQFYVIQSTLADFGPTKINDTNIVSYRSSEKSLLITISIPLSALTNGILAGVWEEVGQRHKQHYPYLPKLIHYGLKPISMAMDTAVMNSLIVGSASSIALEDAWLSFAYYLGVNYLGLLFAQLGERATQKIQNKILNMFVSILLYTFLLNPSVLIELMSEGLRSGTFSKLMMPLLSMLPGGLLFKVGEYGTRKIAGKFFPTHASDQTNNNNEKNYLSREAKPLLEVTSPIDWANKNNQEVHATIKGKKSVTFALEAISSPPSQDHIQCCTSFKFSEPTIPCPPPLPPPPMLPTFKSFVVPAKGEESSHYDVPKTGTPRPVL